MGRYLPGGKFCGAEPGACLREKHPDRQQQREDCEENGSFTCSSDGPTCACSLECVGGTGSGPGHRGRRLDLRPRGPWQDVIRHILLPRRAPETCVSHV